MMRYFFKMLLVCTFVCVMSCSSNDGANAEKHKTTADSLSLKVAVFQRLDCLPVFVAEDCGIFDSLGVDVKLYRLTSQLDCEKLFLDNRIDGAFLDSEFAESLVSGKILRRYATKLRWRLVTNKKARVNKISQLADKMVAMTRHSATDFLCDKMLDSVKGRKEDFFRIQVNDVDLRLKMLLNNEIDAAWLPEPQSFVAVKNGGVILMDSYSCDENMSGLFFLKSDFADDRKKRQIEKFLCAYELATERIGKNSKEEYADLIKRYFGYNNVSL